MHVKSITNESMALDCEVYPNYFLLSLKRIDGKGEVIKIEVKGENSKLTRKQAEKISDILINNVTIGFNVINYDLPIIKYAMQAKTCAQICKLSNYIIENRSLGWQTCKKFNLFHFENINCYDLEPVAPAVKISLKMYGARIHMPKLQELPIEPNTILSDEDMVNIANYCVNDLDTTICLYNKLVEQFDLRFQMSQRYGIDLMSKSDAQMAEAILKNALGKAVSRPLDYANRTVKYNKHDYIEFKTKDLKDLLDLIVDTDFVVSDKNEVELPKTLKNRKTLIGDSEYTVGIGGLHSKESKQTYCSNENYVLIDKDVASYYPSLIINLGLYPKNLGNKFLEVYSEKRDERLEAKKNNDRALNECLKILLNGSFGKLGSKYSILYSPDLLLNVTLTGQLSLLMLIENLELNNFKVISANTDGFVTLVDRDRVDYYHKLCSDWESVTGLVLEDTIYKSLHSSSVNEYLAVKLDGSSKGKSGFATDITNRLKKNPKLEICYSAARDFIVKGCPVDKTIKQCKDITKFIQVRKVEGGAEYKGRYLGKVVRFVYIKNGHTINYVTNGNKVSLSDGSKPLMDIENINEIPENLDYDKYISMTYDILENVGYL